jgi:hypothetical protein
MTNALYPDASRFLASLRSLGMTAQHPGSLNPPMRVE